MSDVKFDDKLQPNITSANDLEFFSGRKEFEQHLRLISIDRLFGTLSRYNKDDVENKIRVEIKRIARDLDYIDNIHNILIDRTQTGFDVHVEYIEDNDFVFTLDDT